MQRGLKVDMKQNRAKALLDLIVLKIILAGRRPSLTNVRRKGSSTQLCRAEEAEEE